MSTTTPDAATVNATSPCCEPSANAATPCGGGSTQTADHATSDIRETVRARYGEVARRSETRAAETGCCGTRTMNAASAISQAVGYSQEQLDAVPEGANLGLGCGNPTALADIKPGETILDLGSGAGFDAFLAARAAGPKGSVIGVDMTPDMLSKARANAAKGGYANVEFRLGEIEHLPVANDSIDLIISNCVVNLSPDKPQTFREAHRVLKTGGRMMISDLVLNKELPPAIENSIDAYVGCIAGAMQKTDYLDAIRAAGFSKVRIVEETIYPIDFLAEDPMARQLIQDLGIPEAEFLKQASETVASIRVRAEK